MCGCGDGFEAEAADGRIRVSFFRDDAGAKAGILRERAEYAAGKSLLREIMMERKTFLEFLSFLESAELDDSGRGGPNKSHLAPTHLLDDIYAVWLQGGMPAKAVFGGGFREMFRLELTGMDRDVLVVQMRGWLAREKTHGIPEGVSPHVDRLAGTSGRKAGLDKGEVKAAAATAWASVVAAGKAAVDAARKTADPEGYAKEEALYGEDAAPRRGAGEFMPVGPDGDGLGGAVRDEAVPSPDGDGEVPDGDPAGDVVDD